MSAISNNESFAARRFLRLLGIVSVLSLFAVFAVNYACDPYGVFGIDPLHGLTRNRPATFSHLRVVKAYAIRRIQPHTLILGSSRAETGLRASYEGWESLPVYNAGLSDAPFLEVAAYFDHACAVGDVREALVLLDYDAFVSPQHGRPGFDRHRLGSGNEIGPSFWWQDVRDALVSWDATVSSVQALLGQSGEHTYFIDGSRDNTQEMSRIKAKGGLSVAFKAYEKKLQSHLEGGGGAKPNDYQPLRDLLRRAYKERTRLHLVVSPQHGTLLRLFAGAHGAQALIQWRRDLVQVIEEEAERASRDAPPLWDFSLSDPAWMSVPQLEADDKGGLPLYFEGSHFSQRFGDQILAQVLGNNSSSSLNGMLLRKDTVDLFCQQLLKRLSSPVSP